MNISWLSPPKQKHADFYDEANYILAYRMMLFISIALFILGLVLMFYFDAYLSTMTFVGLFASSFCFYYIKKTGRYKGVVLFFNLLGFILCQITLFLVKEQPHLIDGLWMIINVMFAFMSLNKFWGISFSLLHGFTLSTYYFLFFNEDIKLLKLMTNEELFGLAINVLVCFFIITYLAWQSIKTNQVARKKLHEIQDALENQLEKIRTQDMEKTVMLKEIHHRVKNNLQVITSLLRLQSRELENEEAIIKFKDTTNRVLAMAKIHEKMYQSEELSTINIEDYFTSLANDLVHSYMVRYPIELVIECKIEKLGMKSIVPIALILNELITNSLKHAFENVENARIYARLDEFENEQIRLMYTDSGIWKTPEKDSSFGWELIQALTEQLDGKLDFESKPATKYNFIFKNLDN